MDPLTAFGVFMSIAGTAGKIFGSEKRAEDAQRIAEKNAQAAEEAAADAIARAGIPAMRARMNGGRVIDAQQTAFAGGGVDVNAGSAVTTAQKTRVFSDIDEQIIRNNAAREAMGYRTKASMFRTEGGLQAEAAHNDSVASLIGGIGQVAGVAGQAWANSPADPNAKAIDDLNSITNYKGGGW